MVSDICLRDEFPEGLSMSTPHLVGYARVSTAEQTPAAQLDMLKGAGCERVFVETASGAVRARPESGKALDYMRKATCWWSGVLIA